MKQHEEYIEMVVGAFSGLALSYAIEHEINFPWALISTFFGTYVGWLFNTTKKMRNDAEASRKALIFSTEMLRKTEEHFFGLLNNFFNQPPFDLFLEDLPHSGILGTLLRDSIKSMNGKISDVNEITYLLYLKEAVLHTNEFIAVQRKSVRWFYNTKGGKDYLNQLNIVEMKLKRRIFVIDSDQATEMQVDLQDKSLMDFYWSYCQEVETFYIVTDELKKSFDFSSNLDDFAIYDGKLLIKYDAEKRVLRYDVPRDQSVEKLLIKHLDDQLKAGRKLPFRQIFPPNNF